jgi:hypothetical protein
MATLAQELNETSHCSALLRSARRVGLDSTECFIRLAVARGCYHYGPGYPALESDPGIAAITNEELVALLLLGSNQYDPIAVRCAAQLAGSCNVETLAFVAKCERIERPLSYIAIAGAKYDPEHRIFWTELSERLGEQALVADGILPHWSRFVSQTGVTRNGGGVITWLHCR